MQLITLAQKQEDNNENCNANFGRRRGGTSVPNITMVTFAYDIEMYGKTKPIV